MGRQVTEEKIHGLLTYFSLWYFPPDIMRAEAKIIQMSSNSNFMR